MISECEIKRFYTLLPGKFEFIGTTCSLKDFKVIHGVQYLLVDPKILQNKDKLGNDQVHLSIQIKPRVIDILSHFGGLNLSYECRYSSLEAFLQNWELVIDE